MKPFVEGSEAVEMSFLHLWRVMDDLTQKWSPPEGIGEHEDLFIHVYRVAYRVVDDLSR